MIIIYTIDYKKIKENILKLNIDDYLVLKSNAYGFGFKKILGIAYKCGMKKFCVLELKDAIYIKGKYGDAKVLLLGPFNKRDLKEYEKYQIEITITDVLNFALIETLNIPYQVEINSGMNRFGLGHLEIDLLKNDERFKGIYSHNATNDINHINNQLQIFFDITKNIINKDIHFASSSIKDLKIPFATSRRIGCEIYKESLCIFGNIIQINQCNEGDYLGYGYAYKFKENSYIGVIDVGYADGLERKCEGFLVLINDKFYPLVGRACMNHSFVLIDENITVKDRVIIIGKNNPIVNYLNYFNKIAHEVYLSFLKKY